MKDAKALASASAPDQTAPRSIILLVLLAALTAVPPLSIHTYLPSLPAMVRAFDTNVSQVQLTISVFFATFAVVQLAYGPLSDRFGRRPIVIIAMVLYVAGSLACLMAPTIEALLIGRVLQASGAAGGPVLARAVVADLYGRDQAARMLATMGAVMGIGPAVAPFIGGFIETHFGWHYVFWFMFVLGTLLLLGTLTLLQESIPVRNPHALQPVQMIRNYGVVLRSRMFLAYALTLTCAFAGVFTYLSSAPYIYGEIMGLSADVFGLYYLATAGTWTVSSFITARMTPKLGLDRTLKIGTCVIAAAGLTVAVPIWFGILTVPTLLVAMAMYAYGMGIVIHNTMAGAVSGFRQMAGAASGMLGFMQMGAGAVATWLAGAIWNGTAVPMATVIMMFALMVPVIFLTLRFGGSRSGMQE